MNKICKKCGMEKDINEFYAKRTACKKCENKLSCDRYRKTDKEIYEKKIVLKEQGLKECSKCGYIKNINKYPIKRAVCKECINNDLRIKRGKTDDTTYNKNKEHFIKNKELSKQDLKECNKCGLILKKEYIKKGKCEKCRREYMCDYIKNRKNSDTVFNLALNLRRILHLSFERAGYTKKSRTYEIYCCSFEYLKDYIEKQFQPWMNWDNWGLYNGELQYGWDIDHIEPLFPEGVKRTEEDIIRLCHYTNLQPLDSKINRYVKKNKILFV